MAKKIIKPAKKLSKAKAAKVKTTKAKVANTKAIKTKATKVKTTEVKATKVKSTKANMKVAKTVTKKKGKNDMKTKTDAKKATVAPEASSLIGTSVASFSVFNSKGDTVTNESLKGRKTVLYFYPKDDTPGCTLEGKEFSSLASEFNGANTMVFGVSKDSVASHDKFICKYDFKIDLISDEKEQLCKIFDVIKEKNMYGKKYMGIERSTFVLDENLKVVKEMRKVSPQGHAQEVLEFVKSL